MAPVKVSDLHPGHRLEGNLPFCQCSLDGGHLIFRTAEHCNFVRRRTAVERLANALRKQLSLSLLRRRLNENRGLLAEFGLVIPRGLWHIHPRVPALLERAADALPLAFRHLIERLLGQLKELDRQVAELEAQIQAWHRSSELSRRLEKIPGIGPLTASALVASIADARSFNSGRQLAAWLGLVPRQSSSGGKPTLLGMSKRGDVYLRTLLIHGARSAILAAQRKVGAADTWLGSLLRRRHFNVAAVALANKNARTVWALLAHNREFRPDYRPRLAAV